MMNKTETMELARAITREARRLNLAVTFSQGYRVVTVERRKHWTRAYGGGWDTMTVCPGCGWMEVAT